MIPRDLVTAMTVLTGWTRKDARRALRVSYDAGMSGTEAIQNMVSLALQNFTAAQYVEAVGIVAPAVAGGETVGVAPFSGGNLFFEVRP